MGKVFVLLLASLVGILFTFGTASADPGCCIVEYECISGLSQSECEARPGYCTYVSNKECSEMSDICANPTGCCEDVVGGSCSQKGVINCICDVGSGYSWSSEEECCSEGANAGKKCYNPANPEDGCCEYASCYDGTHPPDKCTTCYGGSWHSGWQCEGGECVPEASTLVLLATGLLFLVGYLGLRRKEN